MLESGDLLQSSSTLGFQMIRSPRARYASWRVGSEGLGHRPGDCCPKADRVSRDPVSSADASLPAFARAASPDEHSPPVGGRHHSGWPTSTPENPPEVDAVRRRKYNTSTNHKMQAARGWHKDGIFSVATPPARGNCVGMRSTREPPSEGTSG